jgi:hypothetical protein
MEFLLEKVFALVGKIVFPRRQPWRQRRDAKILCCVLLFSLILGGVVMTLIKMIYFKTKA